MSRRSKRLAEGSGQGIAGANNDAATTNPAINGQAGSTRTNNNNAFVNPAEFSASQDSLASEALAQEADPATGFTFTGTDEPRQRRAYTRRAKAVPVNLASVEKVLLSIHTSLAWITGIPEWKLGETPDHYFNNQTEAAFLAKSIKDVSDHYKPDWMDQKTADWIMLLQALGIVYGPRFAYWFTRAPHKASQGRRDNVVTIVPKTNGATPPQQQEENINPQGHIPGVGDVVFPPDHDLLKAMFTKPKPH